MYARNLTSVLVALPYRRKGADIPEMSTPRLMFAVFYGALYWVARELPLWMCWAFLICLSVGAFIANQLVPATPFSVTYFGVPIVYGWMITAGFTVSLTVFRVGLLILRSKWATGVTVLLALFIALYVLR